MSRLAAELGAVNLGQGFPDEDGPEVVREAAIEAIRSGRGNQYPPAHGVPELRQEIARHQEHFYELTPDWREEVVVTTGAAEAIVASVLAFVDRDDEVLMFDPFFDMYPAVTALAGGAAVPVPMSPGFRPDLSALAAAITDRSRVLLLNSPHNPTGTVFTADELEGMAALAVKHDLIVISDEAYEHLTYPPARHIPIATLPGMWERTVTIGSGGKSFSFMGWKVGWASGPADLIAAVRVVRQHLSYVSGGPFQWALVEGFRHGEVIFDDLRRSMWLQRDLLCRGLSDIGIPPIVPDGTYFAITDVRPLGFDSGAQFCDTIPDRVGVVAIPLSALSEHPERSGPYVRWAFSKRPETIQDGLARLSEL